MIAIGESFAAEDADDRCFGCAQANARGLRLRFRRTGERTVESVTSVPSHFCGFKDVVHGGIQAALLDEVMSSAINLTLPHGESTRAATVELDLRYRRPVPVQTDIRIEGELTDETDRDFFVTGRIVDAAGAVLTTARGRWRKLRREAESIDVPITV